MRKPPKLRVVGGVQSAPRNLSLWTMGDSKFAIEVISFDQWDAMHPKERPEGFGLMHGVGMIRFDRYPENEVEDYRQLRDRAEAYYGPRAERKRARAKAKADQCGA